METKKAQAKKKFVSLAEARPDLAKEWNYEKNGNLRPEDVSYGSGKKVWWIYHYDVPDDYPVESLKGKHFDFEWEAVISSRTGNRRLDCPYLTGRAVWPGFNDLATINPRLACQWHPTKNGDLKPTQVTATSGLKIWWLYKYNDPNTGKHFKFEWQATIAHRNNGRNCPYLSGQAIWPGFNDLATVNPELAAQWHPIKNGSLKPTQVTANTNQKVWWLYKYDDPNTEKHFKFEWQASISTRNNGSGCPYLAGKLIWPGFNDLATINPELAEQWHPTKNGDLKSTQVAANSNKKVWWMLKHYDPNTEKVIEFEWRDTISHRNNGRGCPYLTTYKGEEYIKKYLQENNTAYYMQQKFSDLFGTGNRKLSYDFSIPDAKYGFILIEYNGIQHYEVNDYFGGESAFKKQQEHDRRKREYAKQHGYKTIKYTYDTYEKVAEYLDKYLPKEDCKKVSKKAA